jgi:hypothetical protein
LNNEARRASVRRPQGTAARRSSMFYIEHSRKKDSYSAQTTLLD